MADPIQQIKNEANIVELISEYIPVKRSGTSYLALCPFHNDSKPSMYISPSKGIYKCFSCGAGGDLIKFYQEYHKKEFKDALKDLAQKYNIELDDSNENKQAQIEHNKKIKMHELAAKFYHEQLLASFAAQKARDYLVKRNISTATINNYKLGYAPADYDLLIKHLKSNLELEEKEILDAGLAVFSERTNSFIDRFRNKLIIPIRDERDRTIAFGSRTLDPNDNGPKYINSPETDIYHKSNMVFGINIAKEFIRKLDGVIVVEGYFDQIALHQAGFKNSIANQGTALTANQIKLMTKFTESKNIFLCFDHDKAGSQACDRAVLTIGEVLGKYEHQVKIVRFDDCKDADELIQSKGAKAFEEALLKSENYYDYKINELIKPHSNSSPQDKAKAVKEISKILRPIQNPIILSEYKKQIAAILKIDESIINKEIHENISRADEDPYQNKKSIENDRNSKIIKKVFNKIEIEFLILSLEHKHIIEKFFQENNELSDETCKFIFDKIVEISFENPDLVDINEKYKLLIEKIGQDLSAFEIVAEIGVALEKNLDAKDLDSKERYQGLIRRLKENKLKKLISKINEELNEMNKSSSEYSFKLQERLVLESEMHKIRRPQLG
ncbi:MAG: DNA primase [Candidatus Caenarcaniphilales bacterium]|nr:DNA primase [Candidatus Caenarcaniphilales bacterium]